MGVYSFQVLPRSKGDEKMRWWESGQDDWQGRKEDGLTASG